MLSANTKGSEERALQKTTSLPSIPAKREGLHQVSTRRSGTYLEEFAFRNKGQSLMLHYDRRAQSMSAVGNEAVGSSLLLLSAAQYGQGVGTQSSNTTTSLPPFASILHPPAIAQPSSYNQPSPIKTPSSQPYLPPISSLQAPNFPPLADFLHRLSLLQYLAVFTEEGFNDVSVLCDITEDDFAAMNVKRGHRRVSRPPDSYFPLINLYRTGYSKRDCFYAWVRPQPVAD